MAGKKGKTKKSVGEIFKKAFKADKPASEMFKDAFKQEKTAKPGEVNAKEKPEAEVAEKKPASEMFKDAFKQEKTAKPGEEKGGKGKDEGKTEMSVTDIIKDAHEKGLIDKSKYDQSIQKILKSGIEGKTDLVGEIEFIERGGKPEIVLEEGRIEILPGSKVEVLKRDGEISIIVKKRAGEKAVESDIGDLEDFIGDEMEEMEEEETEEFSEEARKKLSDLEKVNWTEDRETVGDIMGAVKEEVKLTDLRREFKVEVKKEEGGVAEEGVKEEKGPGFIDRIKGILKKTTEENKPEKLKRLALENLNRVKGIKDERKAIIGVAYVLKQFLEVKFEIPHEVTYMELIKELRSKEMDDELRGTLITFFKRTSIMVYANMPKMDTFSRAYSLAEKTINELS